MLTAESRAVSPPTTELDDILSRRERADALLSQALEMIAEANRLTPERDGGLSRIGLASELRSQDWYSIDKPEGRQRLHRSCMQEFDRSGWMYLLRRTQMSQVMSRQDKEAYYQQLQKDPPELTRESVTATFVELFGNRHATWRRGVVELFASLRHGYKSHDAFKVGRRMIVPNAFTTSGWNFYRHADDSLNDLQRVIHLLRGEEPPTFRLSDRIDSARRDGLQEITWGPLTLRWYKNGSLHIWLDDETLIEQVNELIAEHYGATLAGRKA